MRCRLDWVQACIKASKWNKTRAVVGGATRHQSIQRGLAAVAEGRPERSVNNTLACFVGDSDAVGGQYGGAPTGVHNRSGTANGSTILRSSGSECVPDVVIVHDVVRSVITGFSCLFVRVSPMVAHAHTCERPYLRVWRPLQKPTPYLCCLNFGDHIICWLTSDNLPSRASHVFVYAIIRLSRNCA
jgi:hypothetical protein